MTIEVGFRKATSAAWTDERIELGKKLFAEGLSASQIAASLGGITRNAVIGKANRMGWARPEVRVIVQQPSASRRARKGRSTTAFVGMSPRNTPQPGPYHSALSPDDIPRHQRRSFDRLHQQHCRFPYGTPGADDFFFCGAIRRGDDVPYCEDHCRIAYVAVPRTRTPYVYRGP